MAHQKLNEKALAKAGAMLGAVGWIVGVFWHGFMGNPSMMSYMYPWFSYTNPMDAVMLLIVESGALALAGFLIATFYNWNLKRN